MYTTLNVSELWNISLDACDKLKAYEIAKESNRTSNAIMAGRQEKDILVAEYFILY